MKMFEFIPYDEQSSSLLNEFRKHYEMTMALTELLRDGRSKTHLVDHLEESYMWVGKAIRDDQIVRGEGIPS